MKKIPEWSAPSTVAIAGHPIHPMLVPFPIAFLVGALGSDLGFWWTEDAFWPRASLWLLGAGIATGGLAAVVGFIEFVTIARARRYPAGWIHFLGNAAVLGLAAWNLLLRWGDSSVVPELGLGASVVTVGLLLVTGWMGGELAYRYKIGVIDDRTRPKIDAISRTEPSLDPRRSAGS